MTSAQGFTYIMEWICSFQTVVILLVHVVFYISNLILIKMMKRESLQDDFSNDSELELLIGASYTLFLK